MKSLSFALCNSLSIGLVWQKGFVTNPNRNPQLLRILLPYSTISLMDSSVAISLRIYIPEESEVISIGLGTSLAPTRFSKWPCKEKIMRKILLNDKLNYFSTFYKS
jgi:hypothetical protein